MIYLDYSATTPVSFDCLDSMNKVTKEFIGNANSIHSLGVKSKEIIESATKQIAECLNVLPSELTYTSGATESNNLALIGTCLANIKNGRHIILSKLEHPSMYKIADYLESIGFEVSYVNNDEEGLIDFEHLRKLVREDTTLISICSVNSETGVRQPLKMIRQIVRKVNPNVLIHSDMTQALGKVSINVHDVDMASFSAHKIFGPKGIGLLYKNNHVHIKPLLYGVSKTNALKPGTLPTPLIVGFSKAMRIACNDLDRREVFVDRLNQKICKMLENYPNIKMNKTKISIPHILNISLMQIKPETFIHALEEKEVYVSTNTACSSGELSTSVMAIYKDKERAISTIRISLSYVTTTDEVNKFIEIFQEVYERLSFVK